MRGNSLNRTTFWAYRQIRRVRPYGYFYGCLPHFTLFSFAGLLFLKYASSFWPAFSMSLSSTML
jgi:hypothetical protein